MGISFQVFRKGTKYNGHKDVNFGNPHDTEKDADRHKRDFDNYYNDDRTKIRVIKKGKR